ncbi:MAG: hypothetical protein ACLGI2_04620 [Acidimicrobiia bacterium]
MTDPVDRLLDLFFYAPLGLALKAAEELPKLAAHGRERVGSQSDLARMVGKMAVAQGRRKVDDLLERRPPGDAVPPPGTPPPAPGADFVAPPTGGAIPVRDTRPAEPDLPVVAPQSAPDVAPAADVAPSPAAEALPIPGYDSLSASQVVQRLAGLSPEELEAVRAYEQAGRGRKTVLLRVAQLRAAS